MVDDFLSSCEICAKHNVRKGITTPIGHIPVPEGPFKHLVMVLDIIKRVQGKRYMLVIIDRFSKWVEAVPLADEGAATVIKFLIREVFPRFGIPSEISSDNGSSFIQKTVKQVLQQLRIKQRLGCVYHPQSQGMVEKLNGTLKATFNKICASTKLNWVDALPLVSMSYRMQINRSMHLTPHEMLTGRPMPATFCRDPYKGPPLEQLQMELRAYMKKLTAIHKAIYLQETRKQQPMEEAEAACPIVPGDLVYLRVFRRKWNEPRREGPYKVVTATPTAVQVEGSNTWYHLNHCTRVPKVKAKKSEERIETGNTEEENEREHSTRNSEKDQQGAIPSEDTPTNEKNEHNSMDKKKKKKKKPFPLSFSPSLASLYLFEQ